MHVCMLYYVHIQCMHMYIKTCFSIEGKVDAVTFATGTGGTLAGLYIRMYIFQLFT